MQRLHSKQGKISFSTFCVEPECSCSARTNTVQCYSVHHYSPALLWQVVNGWMDGRRVQSFSDIQRSQDEEVPLQELDAGKKKKKKKTKNKVTGAYLLK